MACRSERRGDGGTSNYEIKQPKVGYPSKTNRQYRQKNRDRRTDTLKTGFTVTYKAKEDELDENDDDVEPGEATREQQPAGRDLAAVARRPVQLQVGQLRVLHLKHWNTW